MPLSVCLSVSLPLSLSVRVAFPSLPVYIIGIYMWAHDQPGLIIQQGGRVSHTGFFLFLHRSEGENYSSGEKNKSYVCVDIPPAV